jgi:hypothetical protein
MLAIVVGRFTFLFVYIRLEFSDFHSVHRVNSPKNNRSKSIGLVCNFLFFLVRRLSIWSMKVRLKFIENPVCLSIRPGQSNPQLKVWNPHVFQSIVLVLGISVKSARRS